MNKHKIGILGGTFNPIHNGHLMIAENAYREYGLEEVWIMPALIPPHKRQWHILDDELRYQMVCCAVKDVPYFKASDFEIRRREVSYTADTLALLTSIYPENEYYFIMGADSLFQIESWRCPENIFVLAHIVAAVRDQVDYVELSKKADELMHKYHGYIHLLSVPKLSISSTMLRTRAAKGQSLRFFVPDEVCDFIEKNQLYVKEPEKI